MVGINTAISKIVDRIGEVSENRVLTFEEIINSQYIINDVESFNTLNTNLSTHILCNEELEKFTPINLILEGEQDSKEDLTKDDIIDDLKDDVDDGEIHDEETKEEIEDDVEGLDDDNKEVETTSSKSSNKKVIYQRDIIAMIGYSKPTTKNIKPIKEFKEKKNKKVKGV